MPSVYDLKPRFQALLRPLLLGLARLGFTANGLTLLALLGSLALGALVGWRAPSEPRWLLALPVWLFLRMALNALDGMLARELDMKSDLGAVLNEVGDVLSDCGLYLPLAFVAPAALWPVVLFTLLATLTELCGLLGQALGGARQYQGPMGKSDRALAVGALALVTALRPDALAAWPWVFGLAAVAAVLTCLRRCQAVLAERSAGRRS